MSDVAADGKLYYAQGLTVWKSPIKEEKIEGATRFTVGFPVCTVSEYVGEEGAAAVAELLQLGEAAQTPSLLSQSMAINWHAHCGALLAVLEYICEATGEQPDNEDAALVKQIEDDYAANPVAQVIGSEPHPDDLAVDRFATAMKAKLAMKRDEGRGGWDDKDDCSQLLLSQLLREHVEKGDPLDVGNFAMMLHQREERVASLLETLQGE